MALTLLNDLVPYELYFRTGYMEGLDYFVNIFGANSNNTIRLESENSTGLKKNMAIWKSFGNITRRDITVDTAQDSHKIERAEHTAFKTFWKFKPVEFQLSAFKTSDNMTPEQVMFMIGNELAKNKLVYSVSRAIAIVSTAIASQGEALTKDYAAEGKNFTVSRCVDATALFGDQANALKAMVMHSAVFFSMVKDQMVNYQFNGGSNLMLYGGSPATYGKPVVITDNPALMYKDDAQNQCYKTLFLSEGAVTLADNGNTTAAAQTVVGNENIKQLFQAEGDMFNYVKGYQLKSTVGSNPTDADLSTPANWEKWVTSNKNTAGVLIKSFGNLDVARDTLNVRVVS